MADLAENHLFFNAGQRLIRGQFDGLRIQLRSFQKPRLPLAMPSAATAANLDLIGRHNMIWMSPSGKNRKETKNETRKETGKGEPKEI